MKQTEMRRNSEIHQPTDVLLIENVLSPPVLNTEGDEQRDLLTTHLLNKTSVDKLK